MKRIIFLLIVIIIGLVLFIYFKDHSLPSFKSFFEKDSDPKPTELIDVVEKENYKEITLKSINKKITKDEKFYIINAEYPVLSGISDKIVLQKINAEIKRGVENTVEDFLANISSTESYEKDAGKNELSIGVKEYVLSHGIISVVMRVSDYQVGTTHPESYGYTNNFQLKDGNVIVFSDLFKSDSKYLTTVSKLSVDELKSQLKPDESALIWIKSGASSNPDNFIDFKIVDESLVIYFNPYQVSSYTNGIVQISLPLSSLSDIINTEVVLN